WRARVPLPARPAGRGLPARASIPTPPFSFGRHDGGERGGALNRDRFDFVIVVRAAGNNIAAANETAARGSRSGNAHREASLESDVPREDDGHLGVNRGALRP